jgi:hypothetical protein
MDSISQYDWSIIDRDLLAAITSLVGYAVVDQKLTPTEFTAKIRQHMRFFKIPVNVTSSYHRETNKSEVWVGGLYDSIKDLNGLKSITLRLQYNPTDKYIKIKKSHFNRFCISVADTILHEIIHMRQYRRRSFKDIPGYESIAESSRQRVEQNYLGHYDEIDAYSFNIACMLDGKFRSDADKIINYLNKDLKDRRLKKNPYLLYLDTFDHNHNHTVIKKLKKKIMYYLPYAKLCKPYKTTDWLK